MHYLKCVTKIQDEIKKTFMSEENIKEAIRQRFIEITANIPPYSLPSSCKDFKEKTPNIPLKEIDFVLTQLCYDKLNFSLLNSEISS